jgi:hypothetical protein
MDLTVSHLYPFAGLPHNLLNFLLITRIASRTSFVGTEAYHCPTRATILSKASLGGFDNMSDWLHDTLVIHCSKSSTRTPAHLFEHCMTSIFRTKLGGRAAYNIAVSIRHSCAIEATSPATRGISACQRCPCVERSDDSILLKLPRRQHL